MHVTFFLAIGEDLGIEPYWILGLWCLSAIYGLIRLHKSSSNQDSIGKGDRLAFCVVYLIAMCPLGLVGYIAYLFQAYSQVTDW